MHILKASLTSVVLLSALAASVEAGNATNIYADYDYCQGINPISGKTYEPIRGAQLQKVQVMMRHGDRTPATSVLPGDHTNYDICARPAEYTYSAGNRLESGSPNLRSNIEISDDNLFAGSFWRGNCELGQLTNKGSAQTREVGVALRDIYINELGFLSKTLNPDDIYLRNTYVWRTRTSAENFLNGLYPPSHRRRDSVVTLNTYPQSIETLTLNPTACPKLGVLFTGFFKTPTYLSWYKANYALITKVNTVLGVQNNAAFNSSMNGDAILPRYCNKMPLPCSATNPSLCLTANDVNQVMRQGFIGYSGAFRYEAAAEQVKRLAAGPFLKTLGGGIRATISGKSHQRVRPFEFYSAHDQSLDQVLAVIADPGTPWPAYASTVIFETWRLANKALVIRVLYEGKVVPANPNLKCSLSACPIETFLGFIESYVPKNIVTECSL
ncbi:phosphoglycerate mutase-like protein [Basidiobolus meristosporus CBS 931.73]|uniref:Phosphoglycerate mutase-like protein n=1 Tax=Basidiobolus meristosporus CBS 931.73 TaxID=1314790 RepID=A0A1Y1Z7Q5_9FUNG|nr:phosphoglycerate mutase-like protein [Basidiobolus meristosporus CBS 931.73]|eukprot:ORY06309.1 phosphoglycerate mutase-like protein [Basidiobolus meristosporus CBS 931.73]